MASYYVESEENLCQYWLDREKKEEGRSKSSLGKEFSNFCYLFVG